MRYIGGVSEIPRDSAAKSKGGEFEWRGEGSSTLPKIGEKEFRAEIAKIEEEIALADANIERILAEMKNGRDTAREAGLPESSIQHAEAAITVEKMEFVNKKKVLEAQKKVLEDKLVA
jgi:hypothetical protein